MIKSFLVFKVKTRSGLAAVALTLLMGAVFSLSVYAKNAEASGDYTALFPDMYADAATSGGEREEPEKVVYLTFDDGPSGVTEDILEILDENGVKATFFVIGPAGKKTDERLKRIAAAGHSIGVHSYCHKYSDIYGSVEDWLEDFYESREWIYSVTGRRPDFFRFPGGSTNSSCKKSTGKAIRQEMARRGFVWFDWNAKGGDDTSEPLSGETIARRILRSAGEKNRVIVLCHDNSTRDSTAEALPVLIEEFRRRGYAFAALSDDVEPIHLT